MLLMPNSAGKVHVVFRPPEKTDWHNHPRFQRGPFPRALVTSQAANEPEQKRWNGYVVKAECAHQDGNFGIEHVFGAADRMVLEYKCSDQINRVEALKNEKRDRLPGKNEAAFSPKTGCDQNVSDVALEEKVLRAVLAEVHGSPDKDPGCPDNFQGERNA